MYTCFFFFLCTRRQRQQLVHYAAAAIVVFFFFLIQTAQDIFFLWKAFSFVSGKLLPCEWLDFLRFYRSPLRVCLGCAPLGLLTDSPGAMFVLYLPLRWLLSAVPKGVEGSEQASGCAAAAGAVAAAAASATGACCS